MSKVALAVPTRVTWQAVIDTLRTAGDVDAVDYMEGLRRAAKDPKVTTAELAKMVGPL